MKKNMVCDLIAFWIFGLANTYVSVLMLSGAEDMVRGNGEQNTNLIFNKTDPACQKFVTQRKCNKMSTATILIADMLPTVIVKLMMPFFMHKIPYGFQHSTICILQVIGLSIVGLSNNIFLTIIGVSIASMGGGLGEICYIALTSHYSKNTVSMWSSGTGGAGIIGSIAYASLTEPYLANLSSQTTILIMIIMPLILALTYWFILTSSPSVYRANLLQPKSWAVPKSHINLSLENQTITKSITNTEINRINSLYIKKLTPKKITFCEKLHSIIPLLRYIIPLTIVYFVQYVSNQGIVELIEFDCSSGFNLTKTSQYRWVQTIYQIGVFISRSSVNLIQLSPFSLLILPFLQVTILIVMFVHSIHSIIPHIFIIFLIIFCEGIIGGISYVNTFDRIHKEAKPEVREFSLAISSLSNSFGILMSGFVAIQVHTYVCNSSLKNF